MLGLINRGNLPDTTLSEFENLVARFTELWLTEHNEDGTHRTPERNLNFVPVGVIMGWVAASAPTGWLLCQGQQVSRLTYKGLFDIIGTTYGIGDGSTTFNVPDLRQRFPLGKANAGTGSSLAGTGGAIDHTHTGGTTGSASPGTSSDGAHTHGGSTGSESAHTHAQTAHYHAIGQGSPNLAAAGSDIAVYPATQDDIFGDDGTGAGSAHSHSISSDGSHSHTVNAHTHSTGTTGAENPPYLVVNFIIFAGV